MSALAGVSLERSFGGLRAVAGVDIAVERGQVVAVVGPNGSGKSTLIDLLTGVVAAGGGSISVASRTIHRATAAAVARRGVRRTFQNGRLVDSLSAYDNVRLGLHQNRHLRRMGTGPPSRAALRLLDIEHLAGRAASELSRGERRRVELARAVVGAPLALILDEPTAGLPRPDAESVSGILRGLADAGAGVLMIEHDIELVRASADRVVVMLDGRLCAEGAPTILDDAAVRAALGEAQTSPSTRRSVAAGPTLLNAEHLVVRRGADDVLCDASLDLRAGEVTVLLGGNGSGKTTLLAALAGLLRIERGCVVGAGRETTARAPELLARSGVVHLPQNRHLFTSMTVAENLLVSDAAMQRGRLAVPTAEIFDRLPEIARRAHVPVSQLSGGEQQLVAVARGLRTRPRVILADEPTAALAPGTRARVMTWLRELADDGATVLLAEQNVVEAMAIANRAVMMHAGSVVPVSEPAAVVT